MTSDMLFEPTTALAPEARPVTIVVANGRRLRTTVAYDSYWRFAAERQAMLFRRLRGDAVLTHDAVLRTNRFTNAYRAADRVSQFFIKTIALGPSRSPEDVVFRTLLFKVFNRIETWTQLEAHLDEQISWDTFSSERYDAALNEIATRGVVYSNAYMMPNPPFGARHKHTNHLRLIETTIRGGLAAEIGRAKTLRGVYESLLAVPSFGPFLAFQYTIDLNYTALLDFDESSFVVAGPGALDGIRKCFEDVADLSPADVIRVMTERTELEFERLAVDFVSLWGRRLQPIDCQNLFCEVDKYSRVRHPELSGRKGRTRIKQRFRRSREPLPAFEFPRRWGIDTSRPVKDVRRLEC